MRMMDRDCCITDPMAIAPQSTRFPQAVRDPHSFFHRIRSPYIRGFLFLFGCLARVVAQLFYQPFRDSSRFTWGYHLSVIWYPPRGLITYSNNNLFKPNQKNNICWLPFGIWSGACRPRRNEKMTHHPFLQLQVPQSLCTT